METGNFRNLRLLRIEIYKNRRDRRKIDPGDAWN